ncbi:MAG: NAD-dependent epimerase/dehydratase family protein [Myxococcales bacterium]
MRVLVAGISGKLGRKTALRLRDEGHEVAGLDRRPWPDAPAGLQVHAIDVRKRPAEEVFRRFRPEAVVHLATMAQLSLHTEEQLRQNLGSTRAVFDACHRHRVRRAIFVGRHTFYGAAADAPLYHTEDEPPLEVASFPALADLVAADLYAGSAFWRFPEMATAVLRLCYTLGPSRRGILAGLLQGRLVPAVLGFDPLFQILHEDDATAAIALAVRQEIRGVFNVAGPPPLPMSLIARLAGRRLVALPGPILRRVLGRLGFTALPAAAIGHLQYPVVVDDGAFRKATGFRHERDADRAIDDFRLGEAGAFPLP